MVPWMQVISAVSLEVQHTLKSLRSSGEAPWWHFKLLLEEWTRGDSDTRGEGQEGAWHFPQLPVIVLLSLHPKH